MLDIWSKIVFILTFGQFGEQDQYLNFKGGHFVGEDEKQAVEKSIVSSTSNTPQYTPFYENSTENIGLSIFEKNDGWRSHFFDTGGEVELLDLNRMKRDLQQKSGNETHVNKAPTKPPTTTVPMTLAEEKAQGIRNVRFKRAILLLIPSGKSLVIWAIISLLGFYSPLYNFIRDVTWATNILAFAEYYKDPPVNSILTSIVQWMNFVVWLELIIEVHVIIISAIAAGLLLVLAPRAGKEVIVLLLVLLMMSHQ